MNSRLITLLVTGFLAACESKRTVSEELHKLRKAGFTSERINGAHLFKEQRLQLDSGSKFEARVLKMIEHAAPHRGRWSVDAPISYELRLFIGSTFVSERMTIRVVSTGDGWFQRGNGRQTWFYSPELAALLAKQRIYTPSRLHN